MGVRHRVVFGTLATVKQVLAAQRRVHRVGQPDNPPACRCHRAPGQDRMSRRGRLTSAAGSVYEYYNFCLPHASLRQRLPQPRSTDGIGSATQWRPSTPAMAAGLTDHIWSVQEVFLFRMPWRPQPTRV
jgi:hypothetical protein